MIEGNVYDADYFLHGKETGKSLYENYRWLPTLTMPMVARIISHCGIQPQHSILDFGCARGYTVRAFRDMGYNAWGYDVSDWALANCDPSVKNYLTNGAGFLANDIDWVVTKDVLEHVERVTDAIDGLMDIARVGVFAVVPLSLTDNGPYLIGDYEKDITHIHRLTLTTWANMFVRHGWSVTLAYRVPGVKDNYAEYERGNGFITARRLV